MNNPTFLTISGIPVPSWVLAVAFAIIGFIVTGSLSVIGWFVRDAYRNIKRQIEELITEIKNLTSEMNRDFVRQVALIENVNDHKRIWEAIDEVREKQVETTAQLSHIQGEHDANKENGGCK